MTYAKESFHVTGLSIRTSNDPGKAERDIPALWARFLSSAAATDIPGITGSDIYCVYTAYEDDHTKPYTVVLGYRTDAPEAIPAPYRSITVPGGAYRKVSVAGRLADGIVVEAWMQIWQSGWDRAYTADYEVYGAAAQDQEAAEVDIFIAVKD
ncbi:GyrI-like domain-containing protein [Taibaiella koreensis]|uniref:GyrI-like domain-containing protein n=1 Tax=Taibaiella koreensis TaxID=1268548 RepID=UPI000E5A0D3C|nr:effector binding domain-containing protein [Taibaiella koreensis]